MPTLTHFNRRAKYFEQSLKQLLIFFYFCCNKIRSSPYYCKSNLMKNYKTPIILFAVFEIIAVSLWLATGSLFYLLNFSYIGTIIGVGLALSRAGWKYAREFIQFGVGAYMLVFLGLICRENMQIEGFWYYLFSGVVGAGVLHYLIAKIFGPLLFGRGWCGYACWTAMILDLLPYKQPQGPRLVSSVTSCSRCR